MAIRGSCRKQRQRLGGSRWLHAGKRTEAKVAVVVVSVMRWIARDGRYIGDGDDPSLISRKEMAFSGELAIAFSSSDQVRDSAQMSLMLRFWSAELNASDDHFARSFKVRSFVIYLLLVML
ncbi:hypothetical protein L1987_85929 [Smallanthus sonchifolius]|uniref:Uncharacterized protein n=1 Tax=Smallanthus sonchifolius TaxID=185202 RepID=A0ACB8XYM6_9ASTR|nr:hypothetical protein L1987_85929 [Smallanthus sonchifolius]